MDSYAIAGIVWVACAVAVLVWIACRPEREPRALAVFLSLLLATVVLIGTQDDD